MPRHMLHTTDTPLEVWPRYFPTRQPDMFASFSANESTQKELSLEKTVEGQALYSTGDARIDVSTWDAVFFIRY